MSGFLVNYSFKKENPAEAGSLTYNKDENNTY